MDKKNNVRSNPNETKAKKPNWFKKNWKKAAKIVGGIGGLGATIWLIAENIKNGKLREAGEFDFNPDELTDRNLADFEKLIPEMADEYGIIHRNVLRQDLDENSTAYWFSTKDIIDPESEE